MNLATQPAWLSAQLNSSNLATASYDVWSCTLEIRFRNGRVYEYFAVPPGIYDGLLAADSAGKFHHLQIKNRFQYHRTL